MEPSLGLFLAAFKKLQECCHDLPDELLKRATEEPEIQKLCVTVYAYADKIREAELSGSQAFAVGVNSSFVSSWRVYERDYEPVLFWVCLRDAEEGEFVSLPSSTLSVELRWKQANVTALHYNLGLISTVFAATVVQSGVQQELQDPSIAPNGVKASEAWDTLTEKVGLDPILALRRRQLIPFVLINEGTSRKGNRISRLLKTLHDANKAYVFGATLAAITLMRSVMESALRELYRSRGENLKQQIDSVEGKLPAGVNTVILQRIRMLANCVVHVGEGIPSEASEIDARWLNDVLSGIYGSGGRFSGPDREWLLEHQVVSLLVAVRRLIEGAPD